MENETKRSINLYVDNFHLEIHIIVRKSKISGYPKVYKYYKYSENEYINDIFTHTDCVMWTDSYDVIANRVLNNTIKDVSWKVFKDCMYIHNKLLNPKV